MRLVLSCVLGLATIGCGAAGPAAPTPAGATPSQVQTSTGEGIAPELAYVSEDSPPYACESRDQELAARYLALLNAFGSWGYATSPDGRSLLFESNRTGTAQLYLGQVSDPSGAPHVIGASEDAIQGAAFAPQSGQVVFWRAHQGNGNPQIFVADPSGDNVRRLTTDDDAFHVSPVLTQDERVVYFRGRHDNPTFDLIAQPLDGQASNPIATFEGLHLLRDVSHDGRHALVAQIESQSQAAIWVVDLGNGERRRLTTEADDVLAFDARFLGEGETAVVISNEGSERMTLRAIRLQSGEEIAHFAPESGEVEAVRVAPRGDAIAVLVAHGSHNRVHLLTARRLQPRAEAQLPDTAIDLGEFATDGRSLVASYSTPTHPADPVLIDARRGTIRALRDEARPGTEAIGEVSVRVERMASFDGSEVPVNVYVPQRAEGESLPVIVKVHGGPGGAYRVRWSMFTAFYLASGFAVVEPNVRGSTGFGNAYERADNGQHRMDAIRDLEAVNHWLRQQTWANAEQLVIQGGSYGGYATYMALAHQPELWAAGIGMFGIVDLNSFLGAASEISQEGLAREFGSENAEDNEAFLRSISPISVVDQIEAPLFVYQGENDARVPRAQQDELVRVLRFRGVPVEYMVAPDEGHTLERVENQVEFHSRSIRFVEQYLGLPGPSGECLTRAEPIEPVVPTAAPVVVATRQPKAAR